jgi:uncharacterized membrane protein YraQ (UPF0718 family)
MWRMEDAVLDVLGRVANDVVETFVADWPYLLASILAAAVLTIYVGTERLAARLRGRRWTGIAGAVLLATLTPFCSCGTTAVVLGMVATEAPWAPIVAFMVASPLTSPSELLLSAGLFGWTFALVYFIGATGLGFVAGGVTAVLEDRGWLAGQARMRSIVEPCESDLSCAADGPPPVAGSRQVLVIAPAGSTGQRLATRLRLRDLVGECVRLGRMIGLYFLAYSALGYLIIEALPTGRLSSLLGDNPAWGVPLAAVLGIPIYMSTEASLPMVSALMGGGLGPGPAMAFLISGAGTSIGAITGALLIARARVVALVVALLLAGAIVLGWLAAVSL